MALLHVLRVFVNGGGEWGNRLGVFLDGKSIPAFERQRIAGELGFSETVFLEDRATGRVRIHAPEAELSFAGHPLVGVAWLLAHEGAPVDALHPPAGRVGVRFEAGLAFVIGRPEWAPPFEYTELATPNEVERLRRPPDQNPNTYVWAWIDEAAGSIRARSFVPEAGIPEDEATGSAALALCARLSRPVVVHQGHGSIIVCRPREHGWVEVGGKTALDGVRRYQLARGRPPDRTGTGRRASP